MAKKYSFQSIRDGIIPIQVSEHINLDSDKVSSYENKIIGNYDKIEKYAKALKKEVDNAKSRKGLKGKVKTYLGKLGTFCANQNKAAQKQEKDLQTSIKTDTKNINNAIIASQKLRELDYLLESKNISSSQKSYFESQRNQLINSTTKSTGYTLSNTNVGLRLKVEEGIDYSIHDGSLYDYNGRKRF